MESRAPPARISPVVLPAGDESDLERGRIFPPAAQLRDLALTVSVAVAAVAYEQKLATIPHPSDLREAIQRFMYSPQYV